MFSQTQLKVCSSAGYEGMLKMLEWAWGNSVCVRTHMVAAKRLHSLTLRGTSKQDCQDTFHNRKHIYTKTECKVECKMQGAFVDEL
eukprot:2193422-Amphidinium_carterae.1